MTEYKTHEQFRDAVEAIDDLLGRYRDVKLDKDDRVYAILAVAMSNLAVAEAIHRVASLLQDGPAVIVNSTGSVTLDPDAVAEAVQQILNRKERNA